MKLDPGTCNKNQKSWAYDKNTKKCKEFRYGGCGGNDNRFAALELCQEACVVDYQNQWPQHVA